MSPPSTHNTQAGAFKDTLKVLSMDGRIVTATQATRLGPNVIALRPQWYGQIDGFSCTPPFNNPMEALEAALGELQRDLRGPAPTIRHQDHGGALLPHSESE